MNPFKPCHSTLSLRKPWLVLLALVALTSLTAARAARIDRYVDKANTTPSPPYDAWTNAATDIQSAVNAAVAAQGDQVIVRAGVYDTGGTAFIGMTNRVLVDKAITLRSENNDPANTIIQGSRDPITTNGTAAVRPVYLQDSGSRLIGFTITNGATLATGTRTDGLCGGGIYASPSAVISNCVIIGNVAQSFSGHGGGGAWGGTFYDSKFFNNGFANNPSHPYGGGTHGSTLYRCLLVSNVAERASGAHNGTLYDCVVSNNTAIKMNGSWAEGGGIGGWSAALPCRAYGCTIVGNTADRGGGVRGYTFLSNCIVKLNRCPVTPGQQGYGGGLYQPTAATACTIISNRADTGDGAYQGNYTNCTFAYQGLGVHGPATVYNSLFYGNSTAINVLWAGAMIENCTIIGNGTGIYDYYATGVIQIRNSVSYSNTINWVQRSATMVFSNTCTTPAYAGWDVSNITADPRLMAYGSGYGTNHVIGNYRLRGDSPCINAGSNQSWMAGLRDLDGNPRLDKMSGIVDMGAYEYVYMGTTILVR